MAAGGIFASTVISAAGQTEIWPSPELEHHAKDFAIKLGTVFVGASLVIPVWLIVIGEWCGALFVGAGSTLPLGALVCCMIWQVWNGKHWRRLPLVVRAGQGLSYDGTLLWPIGSVRCLRVIPVGEADFAVAAVVPARDGSARVDIQPLPGHYFGEISEYADAEWLAAHLGQLLDVETSPWR